jgi:hypothetical protein
MPSTQRSRPAAVKVGLHVEGFPVLSKVSPVVLSASWDHQKFSIYLRDVHIMYLRDLIALLPNIELRILSTKYKLNLALPSERVGMGASSQPGEKCMRPADASQSCRTAPPILSNSVFLGAYVFLGKILGLAIRGVPRLRLQSGSLGRAAALARLFVLAQYASGTVCARSG